MLLANGKDTEPKAGRKKRWFALTLLVLMIVGATVGELPFMEELLPGIDLDMFFFAAVTTVIMAWTKLFPARKYTKYISWDISVSYTHLDVYKRQVQGDTLFLYGDYLFYDGNTQIAQVRYNVRMENKNTTLLTDSLNSVSYTHLLGRYCSVKGVGVR